MPDYDYEPVYPRSNGGKAKMVMALCCLCCGLFFLFGAEGIAWARQASCNMEQGDQGISWNVVIPPKTTTQMQNGFMTSWLWHQVDVYNENATSTPMIGYWSNLDLFFGLLQPLGLSEKLEEGGSRSSWRNPSESWEIILNHFFLL